MDYVVFGAYLVVLRRTTDGDRIVEIQRRLTERGCKVTYSAQDANDWKLSVHAPMSLEQVQELINEVTD